MTVTRARRWSGIGVAVVLLGAGYLVFVEGLVTKFAGLSCLFQLGCNQQPEESPPADLLIGLGLALVIVAPFAAAYLSRQRAPFVAAIFGASLFVAALNLIVRVGDLDEAEYLPVLVPSLGLAGIVVLGSGGRVSARVAAVAAMTVFALILHWAGVREEAAGLLSLLVLPAIGLADEISDRRAASGQK